MDGSLNINLIRCSTGITPLAGKRMIVLRFQTGDALKLKLDSFVGANLQGMDLHRVIFDGQILREIAFSNALLRNAAFIGACLFRAKFPGARLMNAYFIRAILTGCDAQNAALIGVDFSGSDLTNAKLKNSDVRLCIFRGATLKGANLQVINAEDADWYGAVYDGNTLWPAGFDPEPRFCRKRGSFLAKARVALKVANCCNCDRI